MKHTIPLPKYPTKMFQVRWAEKLGNIDFPYAVRYVLIFFGFSIRIHVWKCSDGPMVNGEQHFHSHPWWFITFIIKGSYTDVTPNGSEILNKFSLRFRRANHLHYVKPGTDGCISILLTGRPFNKWGFLVNDKIVRPIKYFRKFKSNAICNINQI